MIRFGMVAVALVCLPAPLPRGPAGAAPLTRVPASPPTLAEAGDSARAAWQRRDLAAFVAPALGGRLGRALSEWQPPGSSPVVLDAPGSRVRPLLRRRKNSDPQRIVPPGP